MRQRRRTRQAEAQGVEMAFEIVAALGAGMDRQADRLVDHQNQRILVEQAGQQVFGRHGRL